MLTILNEDGLEFEVKYRFPSRMKMCDWILRGIKNELLSFIALSGARTDHGNSGGDSKRIFVHGLLKSY